MSAMIIWFGILQRVLIQHGNEMSWIKSGQNTASSGTVFYLMRAVFFPSF